MEEDDAVLCIENRGIEQEGKHRQRRKTTPSPVINVFDHVVGYQSVSLMISGVAVDAALKQGD